MLKELVKPPQHKIEVIIELLMDAFNYEDLRNLTFCEAFKAVYDKGDVADRRELARDLVDYAERYGKLDVLLQKVAQHNAFQYKRYMQRLHEAGVVSTPGTGPTEQPPPISPTQIEKTRQDVARLDREVELYRKTDKVREEIRDFFDATMDIEFRWGESSQERWKASRTVIISKYVPQFVRVNLDVCRYTEHLKEFQEQLRRRDQEKLATALFTIHETQKKAERLEADLSRHCSLLRSSRAWSEELKQQIANDIGDLGDCFLRINEQILTISNLLYDNIRYLVEKLAVRFHISREEPFS